MRVRKSPSCLLPACLCVCYHTARELWADLPQRPKQNFTQDPRGFLPSGASPPPALDSVACREGASSLLGDGCPGQSPRTQCPLVLGDFCCAFDRKVTLPAPAGPEGCVAGPRSVPRVFVRPPFTLVLATGLPVSPAHRPVSSAPTPPSRFG